MQHFLFGFMRFSLAVDATLRCPAHVNTSTSTAACEGGAMYNQDVITSSILFADRAFKEQARRRLQKLLNPARKAQIKRNWFLYI